MRKFLVFIVIGFVVFCGLLVAESGLFQKNCEQKPGCILLQQTVGDTGTGGAENTGNNNYQLTTAEPVMGFTADNAADKTVFLGSIEPGSGFKFELELSSKGAAIRKAALSEFDDRDPKNPKPLNVILPVKLADGSERLSMANGRFVFVAEKQLLPLDKLQWQCGEVVKNRDGSQSVRFEAVIKNSVTGKAIVKLIKTYRIAMDSYKIECSLDVENLSARKHKINFEMSGPAGIGREAVRMDMRKVVAVFENLEGQITSERIKAAKLRKAETIEERRLKSGNDRFLWIAVVSKYFATILRPVPDEGEEFCNWVSDKTGTFYNPDMDHKADSGDETVGADLKIATRTLAAVGNVGNSGTYNFELYLVPKDKRLFDKNEQFRSLGFVQTIDFMSCCCPAKLIGPLAFGILAVMEWMYRFIPNYGVVIIILVFIIRIVIHPLTKKSQVSMSKMTKLAPKAEEIKKKYANNKAELNKHLMALYREQGASPILGMLPMMAQMPIWIALYSAIYASIALRGQAFLPFWITDMSAPDALFSFQTITIPLVGWKVSSFNLLPLMMGVAFYLQQRLMPKQPAANAQAAQQQKMMMIMMPLMFPLMLYKAPSALNLYIMASTFAGVIEQYIIRKHIREKEQTEEIGLVSVTSKTGGKVKKKKPKPFYKNTM